MQEEKKKLLEEIGTATSSLPQDVKTINCLLIGQVSAGKTSFCNAAATAIADEKRLIKPQTVYKSSVKSTTVKLESCILLQGDKQLPLLIHDCRGLHEIDSIQKEDIFYTVDGHIEPGYKFDPEKPISISDACYRKDPKLADKMHCVVYVVDATGSKKVLASENAEETFRDLRERLASTYVPQLVLMNKIDQLHENFQGDLERVFYSQLVQRLF
ncbi:interferon-induced protein 44-like [Saccostrea cucullata]|uniref:interferon-induced protein 44-like n=1 Tax=Saccostrea cuccullata TaxID=36930 RepID=UPI002ED0EFB8